jgi:hypothetical protein
MGTAKKEYNVTIASVICPESEEKYTYFTSFMGKFNRTMDSGIFHQLRYPDSKYSCTIKQI